MSVWFRQFYDLVQSGSDREVEPRQGDTDATFLAWKAARHEAKNWIVTWLTPLSFKAVKTAPGAPYGWTTKERQFETRVP